MTERCRNCGMEFDNGAIKKHALGLCRACYDAQPELRRKRIKWKRNNRIKQKEYQEKYRNNNPNPSSTRRSIIGRIIGGK